LFEKHLRAGRLPGPIPLLLHELRALGGTDLLFGLILWLPIIGPRLRSRISSRLVCPFVAFRDPTDQQVGCLLHPSRWQGVDIRARVALRLFSGFACGASSYACAGAERFAIASDPVRRRFEADTLSLDWYSYSAVAPRFLTDTVSRPSTTASERTHQCQ
jgi:hypothetical protein